MSGQTWKLGHAIQLAWMRHCVSLVHSSTRELGCRQNAKPLRMRHTIPRLVFITAAAAAIIRHLFPLLYFHFDDFWDLCSFPRGMRFCWMTKDRFRLYSRTTDRLPIPLSFAPKKNRQKRGKTRPHIFNLHEKQNKERKKISLSVQKCALPCLHRQYSMVHCTKKERKKGKYHNMYASQRNNRDDTFLQKMGPRNKTSLLESIGSPLRSIYSNFCFIINAINSISSFYSTNKKWKLPIF